MLTFLWRAAGSPEPESTDHPFTDLDENAYYYKAVLWGVEKEITNGTGDGTTFSPTMTCDRATIVTFLWRYEGKPTVTDAPSFTDVEAGRFYTDAVAWAATNGITTGKTATTFAPTDPCSRAEGVTFLYRDIAK